MNIRKSLLGALGAFAIAMFAPAGVQAQEVTLKLHQFLPAQAVIPKKIIDVWADNVERDSGGRIKINRFPSMQLGGHPRELLDQVRNGVVDIVWNVVGYTPGRFPSTEVFELPFMMENARAMSCAYWTMFEKYMEDTEFKDFKVFGAWVHGPGMFHTTDPVEEISDLNGMKIRGASRTVNQLLKQLGATSVGMPVPAIPENLSKGVIDGTTIPWEVTTALKIPELVENHTEFDDTALYTVTFVLAMNKEKYESLPSSLKRVLNKNSGLEFSVFAGGTQADADAPARRIAVENGNNIITVGGRDVSKWRRAAQPVYDWWIADVRKRGIDGQALIDEALDTQSRCARRY